MDPINGTDNSFPVLRLSIEGNWKTENGFVETRTAGKLEV